MNYKHDNDIEPIRLAEIDLGRTAYVRQMMSDEVMELFPEAPDLVPGMRLWALLAANGTPILIADTREAAEASAFENDLETVSLH